MAESKNTVVERYLNDVVAAEHAIEAQLRDFAREADDDEDVRALFLECAQEGQRTVQQFATGSTTLKTTAAETLAAMPRVAQLGHIPEERIVQNLIAAYTQQAARAAMYAALSSVIEAGVPDAIARAESLADRLFHLIRTRSIIAYNMLTITEVDPSVETKYREASWST